MYQVYIDKPDFYEPEMIGECVDFEKACEIAEKAQQEDSEITYTIEETNGCVNSYGEQITTVVKRG